MTLFLLIACHFLCDYPLQGDYLARGKADGPMRLWHLIAHATIHGGAVSFVTGSVLLGVAETVAHALIDEAKTKNELTYAGDQGLHVACKFLWIAALALMGGDIK